jgi:hypothetical protein
LQRRLERERGALREEKAQPTYTVGR